MHVGELVIDAGGEDVIALRRANRENEGRNTARGSGCQAGYGLRAVSPPDSSARAAETTGFCCTGTRVSITVESSSVSYS